MLQYAVYVLLCALISFGDGLTADAATKRVSLLTGDIVLRPLRPATETAAVARSASFEARNEAAYETNNTAPRQLFLISYSDVGHAEALRSALLAGGAAVLSYIPDNTLLVAASPALTAQVSSQLGAVTAPLGPEHKISPDWAPLLRPLADTPSPSLPSLPPDDVTSSTTATAAQQWLTAMRARARAEQLLGQLRKRSAAAASSQGSGGAASSSAGVRYGISVELLPGLSAAELAAVVADWPGALAAVLRLNEAGRGGMDLGQDATTSSSSSSSSDACASPAVELPDPATSGQDEGGGGQVAAVYLCEQHLVTGVLWLAGRVEVKWVAPLREVRTANARSGILLQTGQITVAQYEDITAGSRAANWPYWAAGLQGQGEIVGLSDTGLDVEHCAFQDPRFNGSYRAALQRPNVSVLGVASYAQIPEHRKVAQYAQMGVPGDYGDVSGHGTNVCGSVAGARLSRPGDPTSDVQLDETTGAAPRARLSVVDTQGGDEGGGSLLWVPNDVYRQYLPLQRIAGAFITSESWGIASGGYEATSQGFDRFLWENPDFISLLSAGNSGKQALERFTLTAPAVAKNVVAVGAGNNLPASFAAPRNVLNVQGVRLDGSTLTRMPIFPVENYDLPTLTSLVDESGERSLPMAVALPVDACAALRNPAAAVRGAVVLAMLGGKRCGPAAAAANAGAAGAAAVMFVQEGNFAPVAPDVYDADGALLLESLPVSMLDRDSGLTLIGFIYEGGKLNMSIQWAALDSRAVAAFSSSGPTPDGRIKPDIIAPGELITTTESYARAKANGDLSGCGKRDYAGTSAATPLAAGHVALMRQYLRSGFYPTGSFGDRLSAPFTPSGILLKALLIAGAASMEGGLASNAGRLLGPPPDGFQGWGRVSLAGSLPLRGVTDPRVRLQLADRGEFRAAGQAVALSGLTATGTGPVTVVLAYYDYPADPNAPTALVNDLGLQLWVNGVAYLGNNPEDTADPVPDTTNTVERVLLRRPPAGAALRIVVSAVSLPSLALDRSTPQRWAVAVVGHFEGSLRSDLNPAWVKLGEVPGLPSPPSPSPPPPSPPVRKKRSSPPPLQFPQPPQPRSSPPRLLPPPPPPPPRSSPPAPRPSPPPPPPERSPPPPPPPDRSPPPPPPPPPRRRKPLAGLGRH